MENSSGRGEGKGPWRERLPRARKKTKGVLETDKKTRQYLYPMRGGTMEKNKCVGTRGHSKTSQKGEEEHNLNLNKERNSNNRKCGRKNPRPKQRKDDRCVKTNLIDSRPGKKCSSSKESGSVSK